MRARLFALLVVAACGESAPRPATAIGEAAPPKASPEAADRAYRETFTLDFAAAPGTTLRTRLARAAKLYFDACVDGDARSCWMAWYADREDMPWRPRIEAALGEHCKRGDRYSCRALRGFALASPIQPRDKYDCATLPEAEASAVAICDPAPHLRDCKLGYPQSCHDWWAVTDGFGEPGPFDEQIRTLATDGCGRGIASECAIPDVFFEAAGHEARSQKRCELALDCSSFAGAETLSPEALALWERACQIDGDAACVQLAMFASKRHIESRPGRIRELAQQLCHRGARACATVRSLADGLSEPIADE